jgi:hypothetical protein
MSLTPDEIVQNIRDGLNVTKQQCDEMLRTLTNARAWHEQYDTEYQGLRKILKAAAADLKTMAEAVDTAIP